MEGESKISGDFVGATAMFVLILIIAIPSLYYDKNIKVEDNRHEAELAQQKEIEIRKIAMEKERLGLAPTSSLRHKLRYYY